MIIDLSGILKDVGGVIKVCGKAELDNREFLVFFFFTTI